MWGDRAFSVEALHPWNNVPFEIRAVPLVNILKSLLQTRLFAQ